MDTIQILEQLLLFRSEAMPDTFIDIFGPWLGEHLWAEYSRRYDFDIVRWYGSLDDHDRRVLADHLASASRAAAVPT